MQALILAGGFGTRLAPLTYTRPKPLLPLLNKALIQHVIESLPHGTDVILATNYGKETIEEYFSQHNLEVSISDEPVPLGTAGAVKYAEKYFTGTFLVVNGDIISSLNMRKLIRFHADRKALATISLWPVENVEEFGVVDLRSDGRIMRFVEKPPRHEAPSNLINAGVYCLEPEILDYIEKDQFVSMEQKIFPQIIYDGKRFFGYSFEGFWVDVGRPSSYLLTSRILLDRKRVSHVLGMGCEVKGRVSESSLGVNVHVGSEARVASSVVFDDVEIGNRSRLKDCIIGEGCRIGRNTSLQRVVVGDGEIIADKRRLEDTTIWTKAVPEGYPSSQIGNVVR